MKQITKKIDGTRTFVPIDPDAFPESLHATDGEDKPEERVPVMAYEGYNFMPTSYGYKSYFGTQAQALFDALDARVDEIFVIQTTSFINILIALCEDGIWTKQGNIDGAWEHPIVLAEAAEGAHYEWTYTIIGGSLYCYRATGASYYEISFATSYVPTARTPNFLNMAGQQGIYKAGNRLGFWDSANSTSWSNLDDFEDFVPSLETLAGSAVFGDINGRIVNILPHGEGFIIYATKSIVHIRQNVEATFQWDPKVLISNAGITYLRQAVSAAGDKTHFAWTTIGLYKIESGQEQLIVPEITDFLKENQDPIALRVLEGRYLFIEIINSEYIVGKTKIYSELVPAYTYKFPGGTISLNDVVPETLVGEALNQHLQIFNAGGYSEQQLLAQQAWDVAKGLDPGLPAPEGDTLFTPVWKYNFSVGTSKHTSVPLWTNTPCATVDPNGADLNMCPHPKEELGLLPIAATTPLAITDTIIPARDELTVYDYMQLQKALWDSDTIGRRAIINEILWRTGGPVSKTTVVDTCVDTGGWQEEECNMGRYVKEASLMDFTFTACAVCCSRYITKAIDIYRVKISRTDCEDITPEPSVLGWGVTGGGYASSPLEAAQASVTYHINESIAPWVGANFGDVEFTVLSSNWSDATVRALLTVAPFTLVDYSVTLFWDCGTQGILQGNPGGAYTGPWCYTKYSKTEIVKAKNISKPYIAPDSNPIIEQDNSRAEIIAWKFIGTDEAVHEIPAAVCGGCSDALPSVRMGNEGTLASQPFTPMTYPLTISWPDTEIVLPPSTFLLQDGSIGPIYPTYEGAIVYDLQLKKWGKMKLQYKQLLDYSPINNASDDTIPYETFGMQAGALRGDGYIYLFDKYPTDSYIKYGKIGYYRLGMTSTEEATVHFRTPSTGVMEVETSLDGRNPEASLVKAEVFENAFNHTLTYGFSGKWHNITIKGIYDIQYLEYKGVLAGRR
jgi:hypothetical protein